MKRIFMIFSLLGALMSGPFAQADALKKQLPDKYEQWLDEVQYILTDTERKVFKKLATDQERDFFIGAFWKQRDPTPLTPANEFREDFYRKMREADELYRRGSRPGWKTEMGRVYMALGKPQDLSIEDGMGKLYPLQIWHYLREPEGGLPASFHLIFFKEDGIGDYVLYSPWRHGPNRLIQGHGTIFSKDEALQFLERVDPELRSLSLSLVQGADSGLTSENLLMNIDALPIRNVDPSWAPLMVKYKEVIEMDYSFDLVEALGNVVAVQEADGFHTVHYSMDLPRIAFSPTGDSFEARFVVYGNITDGNETSIYQFERPVSLHVSAAQMEEIRSKPFSFQDRFPIISGRYHVSLLLKNTLVKEFSSLESEISPGQSEDAKIFEAMVLGYGARQASEGSTPNRAFRFNDTQFYPSATKQFVEADTLHVFVSCPSVPESLRQNGLLSFQASRSGKVFKTRTMELREVLERGWVLDSFPLDTFHPDIYSLEAVLTDGSGEEIDRISQRFPVNFGDENIKPWIVSYYDKEFNEAARFRILAGQSMKTGQPGAAVELLRGAFLIERSSIDVALELGNALIDAGDSRGALELLTPLRPRGQDAPELYLVLGRAFHGAGRFSEAIDPLLTFLKHNSNHIVALNTLGDCFLNTGRIKDATKAYETSLELAPDQQDIKDAVGKLRVKE